MFNPYKHLRLASCVVLFLAMCLQSLSLVALGFMLIMTSLVGGADLTERRLDLLEKISLKENDDEKTETPKDN